MIRFGLIFGGFAWICSSILDRCFILLCSFFVISDRFFIPPHSFFAKASAKKAAARFQDVSRRFWTSIFGVWMYGFWRYSQRMFDLFSCGFGVTSNLQFSTKTFPNAPKIQFWLTFCMHPHSDFDLALGSPYVDNFFNTLSACLIHPIVVSPDCNSII